MDFTFKKLRSEILKEGALSAKDKALIALACAVAINCEHCVKGHKEHCLMVGADREEILEAAAVAGLADWLRVHLCVLPSG